MEPHSNNSVKQYWAWILFGSTGEHLLLLVWFGYRCFFEASRQSGIHLLTAIWRVVVFCRRLQTIQTPLVGQISASVVTQVRRLIVATMPPSSNQYCEPCLWNNPVTPCGWQFPNLILCQLHSAKWIFGKLSSDLFSAYLWSVKSCSREFSFLLKLHLGFNKNPIRTILVFFHCDEMLLLMMMLAMMMTTKTKIDLGQSRF